MIEIRVGWASNRNISFQGESDWEEWWGDEEFSDDEIVDFLSKGGCSEGLEIALDRSGFEWWTEVRRT